MWFNIIGPAIHLWMGLLKTSCLGTFPSKITCKNRFRIKSKRDEKERLTGLYKTRPRKNGADNKTISTQKEALWRPQFCSRNCPFVRGRLLRWQNKRGGQNPAKNSADNLWAFRCVVSGSPPHQINGTLGKPNSNAPNLFGQHIIGAPPVLNMQSESEHIYHASCVFRYRGVHIYIYRERFY